MRKILVPVDGSDHALRAVSQALARVDAEVHLLNVQAPLDGNVRSFVDNESVQAFHREEGLKALAPARALLTAAGARITTMSWSVTPPRPSAASPAKATLTTSSWVPTVVPACCSW